MKQCKKCGKMLARNAQMCPGCGNRFTSGLTKVAAWSIGLSFVLMIVIIGLAASSSEPTTQKSEAQTQADARDNARYTFAVLGARRLKVAMRNPDSFRLTSALIMTNGAVCYEYRAQNGFGGMNKGQAVLAPHGTFKTDEMDGFAHLWNGECANRTGEDKTWEVNYANGNAQE